MHNRGQGPELGTWKLRPGPAWVAILVDVWFGPSVETWYTWKQTIPIYKSHVSSIQAGWITTFHLSIYLIWFCDLMHFQRVLLLEPKSSAMSWKATWHLILAVYNCKISNKNIHASTVTQTQDEQVSALTCCMNHSIDRLVSIPFCKQNAMSYGKLQ